MRQLEHHNHWAHGYTGKPVLHRPLTRREPPSESDLELVHAKPFGLLTCKPR